MKSSLLCFLLLLGSCGQILEKLSDLKEVDGDTRQFETSDAEFATYIKSFEEDAAAAYSESSYSIGDIPINFGDTDGSAGVCFSYSDGKKEIIIDKDTWEYYNVKEILIYHELGHCRLGRKHDNSLAKGVTGNDKLSILNEYLMTTAQFEKHRKAYLSELFNRDKSLITASLTGN